MKCVLQHEPISKACFIEAVASVDADLGVPGVALRVTWKWRSRRNSDIGYINIHCGSRSTVVLLFCFCRLGLLGTLVIMLGVPPWRKDSETLV